MYKKLLTIFPILLFCEPRLPLLDLFILLEEVVHLSLEIPIGKMYNHCRYILIP